MRSTICPCKIFTGKTVRADWQRLVFWAFSSYSEVTGKKKSTNSCSIFSPHPPVISVLICKHFWVKWMSQSVVTRLLQMLFLYEWRGLSRFFFFDLHKILHEPPNMQAGVHAHTSLLQEITQSPINTAIVVMTFLIVTILHAYLVIRKDYWELAHGTGERSWDEPHNSTGEEHSNKESESAVWLGRQLILETWGSCLHFILFFSIPAGATKHCQKLSRISESDLGGLQLKLSDLTSNYYF